MQHTDVSQLWAQGAENNKNIIAATLHGNCAGLATMPLPTNDILKNVLGDGYE